jgi:hypothetical protein
MWSICLRPACQWRSGEKKEKQLRGGGEALHINLVGIAAMVHSNFFLPPWCDTTHTCVCVCVRAQGHNPRTRKYKKVPQGQYNTDHKPMLSTPNYKQALNSESQQRRAKRCSTVLHATQQREREKARACMGVHPMLPTPSISTSFPRHESGEEDVVCPL